MDGPNQVRRNIVKSLAMVAVAAVPTGVYAAPSTSQESEYAPLEERAAWIDQWIDSARLSDSKLSGDIKASDKLLRLGRFPDEMWFLTDPINFRPNPGQESNVSPVLVPEGFVTDLASIPRIFWSLIPRDGPYIYSAIVHDYLYWTQAQTRSRSDLIFRYSMEDFGIDESKIAAIYNAVRSFGRSSWDANQKARQQGERRLLKKFPNSPMDLWSEWKRDPDNFR